MTVKEIHLLIDFYLQEINSNIYGNVEPEEKDFIFNLTVLKFIRDIMNPKLNRSQEGFEYTKARYDALKQLKRTVELPVYKSTGNFVYTLLPSDYFKNINSASKIVTFCNAAITTDTTVTKNIVKFSLREIISDIDSSSATAISDEFYRGFNLRLDSIDSVGGSPGFSFNLDNYYPLGFEDEHLRYILLNLLFEEINKTDEYKCYWDFYNGEYNNATLIIESDTAFNLTTFYEEISSSSLNQTVSEDSEEVVFNAYAYEYSGEYRLKANRLLGDEEFETLSDSPFAKSNINSPISRIEQDFLFVELPENSMISLIQLKYIKKPKLINLFLNRNTDIGTDVLDIIAKRTAETLSRIKSNSNAQLIERENLYNE